MGGGASESFLRFLRGMTALGIAVAVGGGVILTLESRGDDFVEVIAGRGPGVVTVLQTDDVGESPFTAPFAVELSFDPALFATPPRSAARLESPHRRHSTADRAMTALAPALSALVDDEGKVPMRRIERVVLQGLDDEVSISDLEDLDGDRVDDDGRFTIEVADGSAVCVSMTATRTLARALGGGLDADGVSTTGVTWSPYGPCSGADLPRPGTDVRVGTTPGTYGAVSDGDVCDMRALTDTLEANPILAAAWVAPLGITVDDIPNYLATLTPVVVLSDVAVTDHALRGDRVAARQVILQRGTAVLVDPMGVPTVRCMSGSPLRAPQPLPDGVKIEGEPWHGFALDMVKRIPPGESQISEFVLVDVKTGLGVERSVGSAGGSGSLAGPIAGRTGG